MATAVLAAGGVHVVNNGAEALVLATTALAAGSEIARGDGGDRGRLPDPGPASAEKTAARI